MNTNINPQDLPDIEQLQNLANNLFKSKPNEIPNPLQGQNIPDIDYSTYREPRLPENISSIFPYGNQESFTEQPPLTPLVSTRIPHLPSVGIQAPVSASGLGVSQSAVPDFNQIFEPELQKFPNQPTTHQSEFNKSNSSFPYSIAGIGASPDYLQQGKQFKLDEPVSSFQDKNLQDQSRTSEINLPFVFDQPFLINIEEQIKQIHLSESASRFSSPTINPENAASYYFLAPGSPSKKVSAPYRNTLGDLVKKDFPILNEKVNGKPLIWFDNAATTQKPKAVIDRISYFYEHENSNIHRAAHELAARATDAYEKAREKVRAFIGAKSVNEIIFVRGATEAINLVAKSWGEQKLNAGDEIIVSHLEHHANIVPWKQLADKKGLILRVIPVDDDGQILIDEYGKLLNSRTKLVAVTQVSNALGTVTPIHQLVAMAHAIGAKALVDGAQSVSHMPVNVQAMDADWFVFSGHKVFGPTGIGVVYGKEELLNETQPWQGGGNMIQDVTFEQIQYHKAPQRFEAGTGNIADAVGLGAAIDYVSKIGMEVIDNYEHYLLEYATQLLKPIPGVRLIGTAAHKASVLSFVLQGYSNDQVGQALNKEGIAVRTGHHCAQPILRRMGVESTVRPSLAFYNTCQEVDHFIEVISRLSKKKK